MSLPSYVLQYKHKHESKIYYFRYIYYIYPEYSHDTFIRTCLRWF